MDFPSSPPSLLLEPPTSPPRSPSLPLFLSKRRRCPSRDEFSQSSDPIFSESASETDERAGSRKAKKQFKGTWWEYGAGQRLLGNKADGRNADSGVWMGSDSTDDALLKSETSLRDLTMAEAEADELEPELPSVPVRTSSRMARGGDARSEPEMLAERVVQYCLDRGIERIDLSDLNISCLSDSTLRPLHQLIRVPNGTLSPPTSDQYQSFTPALQLFLSKNALTSLPRELFLLQNLTVLSIRNNAITELPAEIAQLTNLVELNVAGNQLRWLPWEMLRLLGKDKNLRRLTLRPNPFIEIEALRDNTDWPLEMARFVSADMDSCSRMVHRKMNLGPQHPLSELLVRLHQAVSARIHCSGVSQQERLSAAALKERLLEQWHRAPIYLASSAPVLYDFDGTLVRSSVPSTDTPDFAPCSFSDQPPCSTDGPSSSSVGTSSTPPTRVPSLFELALRHCRRIASASSPSSILALLPPDAPDAAVEGLKSAIGSREREAPRCAVCGTRYVLKKAEWIEYWHCLSDGETFNVRDLCLPFLRRSCSWGCRRRDMDSDVDAGV
ncbi:hypothetical protein LTR28_003607 [Elasticomyces elasticus]|nr:hypothetical protein LTR28_003607 [Elasticomyces elasticus]